MMPIAKPPTDVYLLVMNKRVRVILNKFLIIFVLTPSYWSAPFAFNNSLPCKAFDIRKKIIIT